MQHVLPRNEIVILRVTAADDSVTAYEVRVNLEPATCTPVCGLEGACDVLTGECVCNPGFAGDTCAAYCPGVGNSPCSGHGTCDVVTTGACICDATWDGPSCTARAC